jgi:alanyl-tRNA synthetase
MGTDVTTKAFWIDPYATSHQTAISAVEGADVELASTIFFAFSGGQESDHGTIAGQPVCSARREGVRIIYTLPLDHGLTVGDSVAVQIDWARRYRLMRLHFAAELVLELFYKTLPSASKVGAHISVDKARIDFSWPESVSALLPRIASEANEIIVSNKAIETGFENLPNERRYWQIEGLARVPCGGTHVRATGEIGEIRLKRNNIGKGKERVEIYLCKP